MAEPLETLYESLSLRKRQEGIVALIKDQLEGDLGKQEKPPHRDGPAFISPATAG